MINQIKLTKASVLEAFVFNYKPYTDRYYSNFVPYYNAPKPEGNPVFNDHPSRVESKKIVTWSAKLYLVTVVTDGKPGAILSELTYSFSIAPKKKGVMVSVTSSTLVQTINKETDYGDWIFQ